VLAET